MSATSSTTPCKFVCMCVCMCFRGEGGHVRHKFNDPVQECMYVCLYVHQRGGGQVRHKFNDPVQVCMCVCMCIRGEGGHFRVCMYVRLCVRGTLLLAQARADAPSCRRHEHHDVPN